MHRMTALPVSVMRRLAEADAFESLGLTRRQALWHVMRLSDEELPLWECANGGDEEVPVALPTMPIGQEVMTDYATTTLSLKKHPVSLVRDHLKTLKIVTAADYPMVWGSYTNAWKDNTTEAARLESWGHLGFRVGALVCSKLP